MPPPPDDPPPPSASAAPAAPERPRTTAARRRTRPTGALAVLPLPRPVSGSRLAVPALVVAFALVLAGLGVADRAIAGAIAPSTRLRFVVWLLGGSALMLLAVALAHERRLARRIASRSAELERLSSELIRVNRAKSEFLANVSHELRTPLNAIVGFVELLHDGVYGELAPRQVGPVERIQGSASHLRELVDQILDLAKIAAGRLEVHPETVNLRPFVFGVVSDLEPLVQEKGLQVSLGVPATLPRVRTDPTHLRQILVNLIGNAVKFTPAAPAGRITVRAALARGLPTPASLPAHDGRPHPTPTDRGAEHGAGQAGDHAPARPSPAAGLLARNTGRVRRLLGRPEADALALAPAWVALQVVDTGPGIPREAQGRIFDEFEQVGPRTGDGAERGTGLGLAISRRLARLLGGDLTVESEPGRGSAFTLWLRVDG